MIPGKVGFPMRRTITPTQMRTLEREVMAQTGMPSQLLMEHAARAVVDAICGLVPGGAHALFACGPGNNGGDGCAAARLWISCGGRATVWLPAAPDVLRGDAGVQARLLAHCGAAIQVWDDRVPPLPQDVQVVVDALFGTGLQRAVAGQAASLIGVINASGVPVVSVDIASGIDGTDGRMRGEAVRAHTTVTFHRPKPGHCLYPGREHTGRLIVADIGIRPAWDAVDGFRLLEAADIPALLTPRPRTGHKGTFGHALVVAGSRGMAGAAVLCAQAALRAGAGLVSVACPHSVLPIVQQRVPCAMAIALPEEKGHVSAGAARPLLDAAEGKAAIAVGCGLGRAPDILEALSPLWALPMPKVLDADALNALAAGDALAKFETPTVLTPHPGEMGRLLRMPVAEVAADPVSAAGLLCQKTGGVALLKGASTVIAGEEGVTLNLTGCAGMATGGSGDVLTGLIAGLCAQGISPYEAACVGAWLHGRAGELCAARFGQRAMTAEDLLDFLPDAMKEVEAQY